MLIQIQLNQKTVTVLSEAFNNNKTGENIFQKSFIFFLSRDKKTAVVSYITFNLRTMEEGVLHNPVYNCIYRCTCALLAKICIMYVKKCTRCLSLKCANTFREQNQSLSNQPGVLLHLYRITKITTVISVRFRLSLPMEIISHGPGGSSLVSMPFLYDR